MSHIIYQTEGIVLGKKDFGEADRVLTVFTKEFGKINAVAQGVRYIKSKLRYSLEPLSFLRVGLVAGKSGEWRIVDAEEIENYREIITKPENIILFSRIISLIDKMLQGEEKNIFLWNKIKNISEILSRKKLSKKELRALEISSLLEILNNLGYIDIQRCKTEKESVSAINKAIKESML